MLRRLLVLAAFLVAFAAAASAHAGAFVGLLGAPRACHLIVDGTSVDWGGHYDAADHDVRDWPTLVLPKLNAHCDRENIAVSGATVYHLGSMAFRADRSRDVLVLGAMGPNNLGGGESGADCYAYLVSQITAARSLGINHIVVVAGYPNASAGGPELAETAALNALVRTIPGVSVVSFDVEDPHDSGLFPDGLHPSCPGSSVDPGQGTAHLATDAALGINAQL